MDNTATILVIGEPQPGIFAFEVDMEPHGAAVIKDQSRQPFFVGCGILKEHAVDGYAVLKWYNRDSPWALRARIKDAAELTVSEPKGKPKATFVKRQAWWLPRAQEAPTEDD